MDSQILDSHKSTKDQHVWTGESSGYQDTVGGTPEIFLTEDEVATRLKKDVVSIEHLRIEKKLLSILVNQQYFYPDWQFEQDDILPGISRVLAELTHNEHPDVSKWIFMTTGDIRLNGKTPIECLRLGQIEPVVKAASCYGMQIAA
jgi:hypothetical protein